MELLKCIVIKYIILIIKYLIKNISLKNKKLELGIRPNPIFVQIKY